MTFDAALREECVARKRFADTARVMARLSIHELFPRRAGHVALRHLCEALRRAEGESTGAAIAGDLREQPVARVRRVAEV
jgi:hypothetical protein